MDVFKLLSRSSKGAQNSSAQKLPSSGAVANPQLFGRHEPAPSPQSANTSRKRKRGQNGVDASAETSEALPADLDFFAGASKEDGDKGAKRREKKQKARELKEAAAQDEDVDVIVEEAYDIDECKRLLRSHKL
jgi:ATP-dependent RNA helicase DDX52/ROK1